ncbi:MAG: AraC family transcriptional regulator [Bacillota bacterium]|nr:AraC family transcriptional regulator [Bacillota bacterium]
MSERFQYSREGYLNENFHYFHLKDTAGQELDFHFHDFDKIVILLSGSVDYTVEGTSYKLKPRDVLLVRNHMIHKAVIDVSVPYERIIIYLNSAYVDRFAPDSGLMECFAQAEKRRFCLMRPDEAEWENVSSCLENLERCAEDNGYGADLMRGTSLTQLMIQLNRIMQSNADMERESAEYNEKIAAVLSYINEHISEELTVDELAARSYLSRYHFMRLFKAQTGCTVHNYIRQKRLNLAARLIREGVPAGRASSECGFSDYSAFHRAFSQTFGVSPGKIKKQ